MTKKDYIKAAKFLQEARTGRAARRGLTVDEVVSLFVEIFKADNVAFDETRFREACK